MVTFLIVLIPALAVLYMILANTGSWDRRRRFKDKATYVIGGGAAILALIPLGLIVGYLLMRGLPGLNLDFFTKVEPQMGDTTGGMQHAIFGSLMIVSMAAMIGVPVGVGAGIYLAEVGRGKFADTIRFLAEVLTGLPSIIAGVLGYALFVAPRGPSDYNAIAGAFALSFLMVPVITRVTEEALRLVPQGLREASFGLGASKFQTVFKVVLPAARGAVLTGIVIAIARVGGETAPLLFTTLGQDSVQWNPNEATAAVPLTIFRMYNQPGEFPKQLAVTGALYLVLWIASINLVMRWIEGRIKRKMASE